MEGRLGFGRSAGFGRIPGTGGRWGETQARAPTAGARGAPGERGAPCGGARRSSCAPARPARPTPEPGPPRLPHLGREGRVAPGAGGGAGSPRRVAPGPDAQPDSGWWLSDGWKAITDGETARQAPAHPRSSASGLGSCSESLCALILFFIYVKYISVKAAECSGTERDYIYVCIRDITLTCILHVYVISVIEQVKKRDILHILANSSF